MLIIGSHLQKNRYPPLQIPWFASFSASTPEASQSSPCDNRCPRLSTTAKSSPRVATIFSYRSCNRSPLHQPCRWYSCSRFKISAVKSLQFEFVIAVPGTCLQSTFGFESSYVTMNFIKSKSDVTFFIAWCRFFYYALSSAQMNPHFFLIKSKSCKH